MRFHGSLSDLLSTEASYKFAEMFFNVSVQDDFVTNHPKYASMLAFLVKDGTIELDDQDFGLTLPIKAMNAKSIIELSIRIRVPGDLCIFVSSVDKILVLENVQVTEVQNSANVFVMKGKIHGRKERAEERQGDAVDGGVSDGVLDSDTGENQADGDS